MHEGMWHGGVVDMCPVLCVQFPVDVVLRSLLQIALLGIAHFGFYYYVLPVQMSSIILCGLTHKSCLQRHRISPMRDVRLQKGFLIDNLSCTDYCTYNNFACTAYSPMQISHLCNSCQHFYLPVYPDFGWMEDLAYTTFLPIHDLPMQYWARTNWQPIHWLLLYTALCVHGFCLYKNCVNTKTKVLPKVLHLICLETKLQIFYYQSRLFKFIFILFQRLPIAHAHPGPNIFYWTWTFGHPEPGNLDFWTFGLWTSSWPAEGFFIGLGLWTSEFGHCPNFRAGPIWT